MANAHNSHARSNRPSLRPVSHIPQINAAPAESSENRGSLTPPGNRTTKSGFPDRRFKGQRDIEIPEQPNPDYKHATKATDLGDGIPRSPITGKPDRRYMQNRAMTPDQAAIEQAKFVLEQAGASVKIPS